MLYISINEKQVDEFVWKLTPAQRLYKHFLGDKCGGCGWQAVLASSPKAGLYHEWALTCGVCGWQVVSATLAESYTHFAALAAQF